MRRIGVKIRCPHCGQEHLNSLKGAILTAETIVPTEGSQLEMAVFEDKEEDEGIHVSFPFSVIRAMQFRNERNNVIQGR